MWTPLDKDNLRVYNQDTCTSPECPYYTSSLMCMSDVFSCSIIIMDVRIGAHISISELRFVYRNSDMYIGTQIFMSALRYLYGTQISHCKK